jgi:hypothetical protein
MYVNTKVVCPGWCRVADFSRYNTPKWGKIYQMTTKVPNGHKIYHLAVKMAIKIPTSSFARPSKIYPNWDFGFENTPSGNTGLLE